MTDKAKIPANDWKDFFKTECQKDYFHQLNVKIGHEYESNTVYPPINRVFNAFEKTPYSKVRVVIIGQDPYHEPGQAMGMSFSVPDGIQVPPSLVNIKKEIESEFGTKLGPGGDLTPWALQGVLLLNATLTVRRGEANSHSGLGWQKFTDAVISCINNKNEPVVFMLWGGFARNKKKLITNPGHEILEAPHPSPLSAHRGFFGCGHFIKCNEYFTANGKEPIDWSI